MANIILSFILQNILVIRNSDWNSGPNNNTQIEVKISTNWIEKHCSSLIIIKSV